MDVNMKVVFYIKVILLLILLAAFLLVAKAAEGLNLREVGVLYILPV